jgi:antitoxin component of MazEF toxin-antitoxin module
MGFNSPYDLFYLRQKGVTMIKQLRKQGNSTMVLLPQAWLDLLNWQAKDNVKLELDLVNKEIKVKES